MLKQNKGSIINTALIAGLVGAPEIAAYTASKHAVIGLTKSAAVECTATGVRVNCVCPGLIESRMLSAIIEVATPVKTPCRPTRSCSGFRRGGWGQALRGRLHRGIPCFRRGGKLHVSGSAYTVDGGRIAS